MTRPPLWICIAFVLPALLATSHARADELLLQAFKRPDLAESVAAFLEKRPPNFPPLE